MNKDEYVVKLSEMGFTATIIDGIIMITVEDEKTARKANKAIKEVGYNASWGITIKK